MPARAGNDVVKSGTCLTVASEIDVQEAGGHSSLTMRRKELLVRPDWDSYFMDIARVVARRGNCLRRRVAAVIVKNRRIISTGYNGTPRGVKNCFEGGCARCASEVASGERLGECVCSHAEENAIT
ncbi:MAG: hypothetical protein N2255_00600, partial [Kiritimatiellae bacterium]|nr:hypothetical protein [Kiritimatiellia bacterium]